MKKKYYVEINDLSTLGYFNNDMDYEIVLIGNAIESMPIEDRNEKYKQLEDAFGIKFIFDNNIPVISFYTVPFVKIFAYDINGFFGFIDEEICYIREGICFRVASSLNDFLDNIESWNRNMEIHDDIVVYASKEDAYKEIDFR